MASIKAKKDLEQTIKIIDDELSNITSIVINTEHSDGQRNDRNNKNIKYGKKKINKKEFFNDGKTYNDFYEEAFYKEDFYKESKNKIENRIINKKIITDVVMTDYETKLTITDNFNGKIHLSNITKNNFDKYHNPGLAADARRRGKPPMIHLVSPQMIEAWKEILNTYNYLNKNGIFAEDNEMSEKKEVLEKIAHTFKKQINNLQIFSKKRVLNSKKNSDDLLELVKKNLILLEKITTIPESYHSLDWDIINVDIDSIFASQKAINLSADLPLNKELHIPSDKANKLLEIVQVDLKNNKTVHRNLGIDIIEEKMLGVALADSTYLKKEFLGRNFLLGESVFNYLAPFEKGKEKSNQEARIGGDFSEEVKNIAHAHLRYNKKYKNNYFEKISNKISSAFNFILKGASILIKTVRGGLGVGEKSKAADTQEEKMILKAHPEKFKRISELNENIDKTIAKFDGNMEIKIKLKYMKETIIPKMIGLYEEVADKELINPKTKQSAEEFFNDSVGMLEKEVQELNAENETHLTKKLAQYREFIDQSINGQKPE